MIFAVSMVKDEADVVGGMIRHLFDEGIEGMVVADNGSTDGTREILDKLATEYPLVVLDDPEVGYFQSEKMSALATAAADHGAEWIVPVDADELWVFNGDRIGKELRECGADIITAELYQYFPTAIDPPRKDPFDSIVWRQPAPAPLPKVAFRYEPGCVIHQGNHGVTRPSGGVVTGGLRVCHFPYRSAEQFVRKARNGAAAYRATDLPEDIGAHWRGYGDIIDRFGEEALQDVFREYFWALSPADEGWVHDPAPYMRWSQY